MADSKTGSGNRQDKPGTYAHTHTQTLTHIHPRTHTHSLALDEIHQNHIHRSQLIIVPVLKAGTV